MAIEKTETKRNPVNKEQLNKVREAMNALKDRAKHINTFSGRAYQNLERLSKDQLIKIIYDYYMGLNHVSKACGEARKDGSDPGELLESILTDLNKYDKYRLYDDDLDLTIDLQLGKISAQEFVTKRQERKENSQQQEGN